MNGRRLLFGKPRGDTHRGWLARHGGRSAPIAAEAEMARGTVMPEFPFALMVDPEISGREQERAVAVLVHVARFATRPIVYARMAIRIDPDHGSRRPVTATASLDISGRIVTARAIADAPLDALDLLERRLRRSVDQLDARRRARRRRAASAVDAENAGR